MGNRIKVRTALSTARTKVAMHCKGSEKSSDVQHDVFERIRAILPEDAHKGFDLVVRRYMGFEEGVYMVLGVILAEMQQVYAFGSEDISDKHRELEYKGV